MYKSTSKALVLTSGHDGSRTVPPSSQPNLGTSPVVKHKIPFRTVAIRGASAKLWDTDAPAGASESKEGADNSKTDSRLDSHKSRSATNLEEYAPKSKSISTLTPNGQRTRSHEPGALAGNSEADWADALAEAKWKNEATQNVQNASKHHLENQTINRKDTSNNSSSRLKESVPISTSMLPQPHEPCDLNPANASSEFSDIGVVAPKRKSKIEQLRERGQHASSILRREPKKVNSEGLPNQKFPKQLWEVTSVEEFNMIRSGNSSTVGTIASDRAELKRAHINTFLHREEETEGLSVRGAEPPEYNTTEPDPLSGSTNTPATNYIPKIQREGMDPLFVKAIEAVCNKHLPVFNTKLNVQPAMVKPMELEVDLTAWEIPSNQGPPRHQTPKKQEAIREQIGEMLKHNIISPNDRAEYYSHPHLTPKPHSEALRFTIDFRGLNIASKGSGWPIPNIPQMLVRLGEMKPRYLGKLDFTSGYHQAPLASESRIFTAFLTFMGVYVWNRVPMGIKRAGGWFQAMLATTVLVSLIYIICELYIDDLIIHGKTQQEFCTRLDTVLSALEKRRITVNPEKCLLGVESLEFVGHTISKDGLHFTREKIDKVLQIPEPSVAKELKSFLGVAVWFIEHIDGYSNLARPLHQMLLDYDRNRILKWTEEGRVSFHSLKEAINNCPMLYFIDDTSPIFVETDASDYGVGGVCYQMIDGVRRYIAFVSHALSGPEINWAVPHKEMYGIVYTLGKLDYLLRDRTFILKTDHKNLITMNTEKNPKVYRWKLAIQDYDCTIEYIEGPKNVIADGMSRILVPYDALNDDKGRAAESREQLFSLVSVDYKIEEYVPGIISMGFATLIHFNSEVVNVAREFTIPLAQRNLIEKCHNSQVGHMGVEKVIARLEKLGQTWPYSREHVKQFIKKCAFCQKMSYLKTPVHTHPFTTAAYGPFQRINIDTIGPLTASDGGYCYILVVICCFTRWVELIPMKTIEMSPTRKELIKYFGRYGEPAQVLSDGGSQFSNEQIAELIRLAGCEHTICLSYSKEENSIVERSNREVMRHVRALIYDICDNTEWEDLVPVAQRIMNGVRNDSNQTSPSEILFGNAVTLDRGMLYNHTALNDDQIYLSKWASNMLLHQKKFMEKAEMLQRQKDDAHIANYPIQRTDYPVGSYVLVEYHASILRKGPPSKMLTQLRGPMKVIKKVDDHYTLLNITLNKDEEVHVSLIRPFIFDPLYTDPGDIARRDYMSTFQVASVTDHTPKNEKLKSRLDFLVKWIGYGPEHDLWLPFSSLRDNPKLRRYLMDNGMKRHINKEHRKGEFA